MSFNLKPADRKAIDLLLDRQRTVAGSGTVMNADGTGVGFSPHVDPIGPKQLAAAERVLGLLSFLPEEEPPAGLLERTLARIDSAVDTREHRPFRAAAVDTTTHA